jgi:hypothetical protein
MKEIYSVADNEILAIVRFLYVLTRIIALHFLSRQHFRRLLLRSLTPAGTRLHARTNNKKGKTHKYSLRKYKM